MTTDNRTNELNKYAGFLARQGHRRDPWRGVGVKCLCGKLFDLVADHAMHQVEEILRAALVADQGAAPAVQQVSVSELAELIAKANYDWSQQRLEFWRRPASVESPGDLDQYIARAVVEAIGGESRG